jgi:hypothetical protein
MANAAKAPKPHTTETVVEPGGTIKRYRDGKLVQTTPAPQANGTPRPAAKAKPKAPAPKPPAAPLGPRPGEAYYVAKLGTEDIWQFLPESAAPDSHV